MNYDQCAPSSQPSCFHTAHKLKIESITDNPLHVFEVQIISKGMNVAKGKNSSQSTTKKTFTSSMAVDGMNNTFSHTDDSNPWWEVDLGGSFSVEYVKILNRWCQNISDPTHCLCRLSNASVSIHDDQGVAIATASTNNTCGVSQVHLAFPAPCSSLSPTMSPVFPLCYPHVRKIKLLSSTGQPIHLFELQVFSLENVNLALSGMASQSSTFKSFSAKNAIDNNVNTFTHTNDKRAWLEVDLKKRSTIHSVRIHNRWCKKESDPSHCLCRLSNVTLFLNSDNEKEITSFSIDNTCGKTILEYVFDPSSSFCAHEVSCFI